MATSKVPVRAVERSFQVLRGLKDQDGAGTTELAEHLDLPKSTVHVHLQTLQELGYVIRSGDTFHVSLKFLELGEHSRSRYEVYETARPVLEDLADKTGELANLLVEERNYGVHIYKAEGDQAVNLDTFPGKQIPLHQTSRGKAMLATFSEERVEEIIASRGLPAATEQTISDPDTLWSELEEIREQGYAVDRGERIKGLHCVAAPITYRDERPIGAISIAGPSSRFTGKGVESDLSQEVKNAANVIELNLSFS